MIRHFVKIWCPIWNELSKETILSKVINTIDVFKIKLDSAYDDTKTKSVHMISKLDNGKSIILELKWSEIRTRNLHPLEIKKWKTMPLVISKSFEDNQGAILIDCENESIIKLDTKKVTIWEYVFDADTNKDGGIILKSNNDAIIDPNTLVIIEDISTWSEFLTARDKRDIVWGIKNNVNMIVIPYVNNADDMRSISDYIHINQWSHIKKLIKIETKSAIQNIESLLPYVDGFVVAEDDILRLAWEKEFDNTLENIVNTSNLDGKPVILVLNSIKLKQKWNQVDDIIRKYVWYGISCFMFSDEIVEFDDVIEIISSFYEKVINNQFVDKRTITYEQAKIHPQYEINDYIIFTWYRAINELNIKAVICYTEHGYTAARIASYRPDIPIIAFTKNDDTYRYLNLLWSVKWYKIWSNFDYNNIKQMWKEIVRMMFKWNIVLEDKIMVIHASSMLSQENIINWVEIYKFRDI